jgi:hypothetical protein
VSILNHKCTEVMHKINLNNVSLAACVVDTLLYPKVIGWGSCFLIFSFMCMFCRSLFVPLAIVLSVLLQFTDSDYPFGIFKLFLSQMRFDSGFSCIVNN